MAVVVSRFRCALLGLVAVAAACGPHNGSAPEDVRFTAEELKTCSLKGVEGIDVFDGTGTID